MKNLRILITLAVIFLIVGLASGAYLLLKKEKIGFVTSYHGKLWKEKAPEFTLTEHNGGKFSLSDLKGKVALLFFGYTHCPDICPTTLSTLQKAIVKLGGLQDRVRVLFITVDPERDTAERLKGYVPYFGEQFIGLTGTPEEIEEVAEAYNIMYRKEYPKDSAIEYLMGHTTSVYLIDPNGNLLLKYSHATLNPEWIAEDIKKILD